LARQFLHLPENFGAPTRIATSGPYEISIFFSFIDLFSGNIIAQRSWPPLSLTQRIEPNWNAMTIPETTPSPKATPKIFSQNSKTRR
jgi:hypothetical protein